MEFEEFHFFCVFRLVSLKPSFRGKDRLWKKVFCYKLIERKILYRLIYFISSLAQISSLGNAKY